jgi:hypothetical protein
MLKHHAERAPLGRNVEPREVETPQSSSVANVVRNHRRSHLRRLRLQHHGHLRTRLARRSKNRKATPAQLPGTTQDEQLLESPRPDEFTHTDPWRVFRIMGEFVEGFDELATLSRGIAIFGSARSKPDDPDYKAAQETAALLAAQGLQSSPAVVQASWKRRIAARSKQAGSQSAATSSCRSNSDQILIRREVSRSNTSSCAR